MGLYEYRFPELGEGLHEGRIERWLVKPGDAVTEDDVLAEVENDKAMVELPSPVDGTVRDIRLEAGATAIVGDIIAIFEVAGEGNGQDAPTKDVAAGAVEQAGLESVTNAVKSASVTHTEGEAVALSAKTPAREPHTQRPESVSSSAVSLAVSGAPGAPADVLATPGVRKYAREQGVDIFLIPPSGPGGKVLREDVERYLAQGQQSQEHPSLQGTDSQGEERTASAAATTLAGGAGFEERIPFSNIRKLIADAMIQSKHTAAHVAVMDEVEVSELVRLRKEIQPLAAERGVKVTYLPFVVKALIAALRHYPILNASYDEETQELVVKHYYHIGIATDTDRGLLVPVIRDADKKNMFTLAGEISSLSGKARENKIGPAEMKGSTISITNIGSMGGLFFTPIINYPEVAILGVGRITEKPIMRDGEIVPGQVMALSLSFDHRIVDGALAQRFVNDIKGLLTNPRLLLMEV